MDEPLSNLDAKLRVQTRAELVELQRRLAATIVYVTHDQVEAMTMGHRIAIMNEGVLQQVGPPQEVYEKPANLFVARFIGSPPMNTVAGRSSRRRRRRSRSRCASGRVPLPGAVREGDRRRGAHRGRDRRAARAPALRERRGMLHRDGRRWSSRSATSVTSICRLADGQMVIVRQQSLRGRRRGEGSLVRLAADLKHLHVFDAHDRAADRTRMSFPATRGRSARSPTSARPTRSSRGRAEAGSGSAAAPA